MPRSKQCFRVLLTVHQECDQDMTEAEMRQWIMSHFCGAEFGKVSVIDCDLQNDLDDHKKQKGWVE